jgi:hypothetical protein
MLQNVTRLQERTGEGRRENRFENARPSNLTGEDELEEV